MATAEGTDEWKNSYQILKTAMVMSCLKKCSKRERNYAADGEICPAKCYDLYMKYLFVGMEKIQNSAPNAAKPAN